VLKFPKKYGNIAHELAQIAQLVEQRTENPRVAGSIPALGICFLNNMVKDNLKFIY
jgi:hypothetical protein